MILQTGDTVAGLSHRVFNSTGIPEANQRLVLDGKQLSSESTIYKTGAQSGSEITLMLRLLGGAEPALRRQHSATLGNN